MASGENAETCLARTLGSDWECVIRQELPAFLGRQRWFAGKARRLKSVRLTDAARPEGFPASSVLALMEAGFEEGEPETYFLPLVVAAGTDMDVYRHTQRERIIASLESPSGTAVLLDGLAHRPTCWALLRAIEANHSAMTDRGQLRAISTTAYAEARGPADTPLEVIPRTVEQSNSVVLYGQRLLMKVFRRIEPGINPDYEVGRFLCEETGFDRIPRTAGTIEYHPRDGAAGPATLALLQTLVANEGTGWEHALGELRAFYERGGRAGTSDEPATADAELFGTYPEAAALLGRRTAELHLALASSVSKPDFAPEPISRDDLSYLADGIRDQFKRTLRLLADSLEQEKISGAVAAQGRRVQELAPRLLAEVEALSTLLPDSTRIRCHGDYHLGQVLWSDNDFVILDFEGEPAKPLDARRRKATPLKDVVGMLRSFDYAAYAGLFQRAGDDPAEFDRLASWARAWAARASGAFLDAYRLAAGPAAFLPADPDAFTVLLRALTLEKALYELSYELNNRPNWVRIPIQGILALARS